MSASVLLLLALSVADTPACSVTDRPVVTDLQALPAWARRRIPFPIAGRDQPFNASDVIQPGNQPPQQRLICAYRSGADWTIEYQQGGIGLFRKALTLRRRGSAR